MAKKETPLIPFGSKTKKHLPWWVWVISILVILIGIYYYGISTSAIPILVMLVSASACKNMAEKIKKNIIGAWFIGFFFGLLGWLGYYIYYRSKLKR